MRRETLGVFGRFACLLSTLFLASSCETKLEGLARAPQSNGPKIVFDLLAKPLPEIPFPNDLATRFDADSPTGLRINASMMAPTFLEKEVREEFNLMDGWGTLSPVTVSFEKPIDPNAVRDAHFDDDYANDAVYLVNLETGEPVPVDLGRGNYPVILQNNDKFFQNDPREKSSNLLFETYVEDCEVPGGYVAPEHDTDADGVCDRPNTRDPSKPLKGVNPDDRAADASERGNDIYRDLLDFYERETNTLIIRPVVSLEQRTPYAVVLTNRIKGEDGESIASPFPFINHASQNEQLRPLLGFLGKGKLSGLKANDIVFTWTFTTQSVTTGLEAVREGLYGRGPLAWMADEVPATLEPVRMFNEREGEMQDHPVHLVNDLKSTASGYDNNRYIVPMTEFKEAFERLGSEMGIDSGPDLHQVSDSYKFIDYFVVGSYRTANLLDDPMKPTFDAVFRLNPEDGKARMWKRPDDWSQIEEEAIIESVMRPMNPETALLRQQAKQVTRDRVWFMLSVPKAINGHEAPFPVSIYGHGYTSSRVEMLGFAGNLAKFGIASVGIDSYGHGLDLSQVERESIAAIIGQYKFKPLVDAIFKGRARDLDNDLVDNSGGDFWVADTFHTRDIVRQSVIDWIQLIRVFHAFGTYDMGDVNGDGKSEVAGDFNGDGIPDVGGPEYPTQSWWTKGPGVRNPGHDFFVWGQSLGGILAGILPAVEPAIAAAVPVAGGAGLGDIGVRSEQGGVIQAVFMEILGPIFFTKPAEEGDGAHLHWQVQNVNDDLQVQLTEEPLDLRPGDVLRAWNRNTKDGEPRKEDWAIVGDDLRVRLQVAADNASFADGAPVWKYDGGVFSFDADGHPELLDPVRVGACESKATLDAERERVGMLSPADCMVVVIERDGKEIHRIDEFPRDVVFQQRHYAKGTPLVALARGFAMKRGTKTFRRFLSLAQTILEAGDPAGYARHYFQEPLPAREGNPAAVLVVGTTGDLNVPVNTAFTQARIAGVLPYEYDPVKHAKWGMSPNDVLIRSKATECIEKLRYYLPVAQYLETPEADQAGFLASLSPEDQTLVDLVDCSEGACRQTALVDFTHYSKATRESKADDSFLDRGNTKVNIRYGGAPRLKHSLQEAITVSHAGRDAQGNPATRQSALISPYLDSHGSHGFETPHPRETFDTNLFMINMIGRYFQTRGTDLRFDICMHRDGYDRSRLITDSGHPDFGKPDPDAVRVGCDFIPEFPATY